MGRRERRQREPEGTIEGSTHVAVAFAVANGTVAEPDLGFDSAALQLVAPRVVFDRCDEDADTPAVAIVLEPGEVTMVASVAVSTHCDLASRLLSALERRIQVPREEPNEHFEARSKGERRGRPVVVPTLVQTRRSPVGGSHNLAVPSSRTWKSAADAEVVAVEEAGRPLALSVVGPGYVVGEVMMRKR